MKHYDPMPMPIPFNATYSDSVVKKVAGPAETGTSPNATLGPGPFVYNFGAHPMGLIRRLVLIQVAGTKEGFSYALYNRGDVFNSDGTLHADAEAYRITPVYTVASGADGSLLDNFGLQIGYANRDNLRAPAPATGQAAIGRGLYLLIAVAGAASNKQFLLNFAAETPIM